MFEMPLNPTVIIRLYNGIASFLPWVPEVFRAGHNSGNRDMTDTGNYARKTSGTQGTSFHTKM